MESVAVKIAVAFAIFFVSFAVRYFHKNRIKSSAQVNRMATLGTVILLLIIVGLGLYNQFKS
jgi:amino acid transporter